MDSDAVALKRHADIAYIPEIISNFVPEYQHFKISWHK